MSELVVALLTWIAGEVGLVAPPPPSIAFLSQEQISVHALTAKWLRAQGVADPYAIMNTDEYTIVAMSACADFGLV